VIFFKKGNTRFGLLKKTEIDPNTFLNKQEKELYAKIENKERKLEFKGIRQLRNEFLPKSEISYDSKGKPNINLKETFISISHSSKSVFIGVSDVPIGIDIEEIHPRILNVQSKFVHSEEAKMYSIRSIENLIVLWTVKESAYKLCGLPGLDFKNEIRVIERKINKHKCIVSSTSGQHEFHFEHDRIENEIFTYNCT
jgi:phosphopantetheinyl transferase